MDDFVHRQQPGRIVFGDGAWRRLPDELARLGARRVLIATSASNRPLAESLAEALAGGCVGLLDDARQHIPVEQAERARKVAHDAGADVLVAVGGGTPLGLAKAVVHETDTAVVAVPTTYSGSEMTGISGITRHGVKRTETSSAMLPKLVIYDPELTLPLPRAATAVPDDLEARSCALYGAYLAGLALGATGIALHHKLCHVLGGSYGLGHGEVNAVVLPYAAAFNAPAAPTAMASVARALGLVEPDEGRAADAAGGCLYDFARRIGAPASLRDLGLDHAVLDEAAKIAVDVIAENPRPLSLDPIRNVLENAWHGERPA
jgi:alcohol dehydrogenase class IV